MQGWQKLLMRDSGRLLSFPGGLSWCINQYSCVHPIECHRNATNEERPLQHFCDCYGKLIIMNQILWHGTSEQRHSLTYAGAHPSKHRRNWPKNSHRICNTKILACLIPRAEILWIWTWTLADVTNTCLQEVRTGVVPLNGLLDFVTAIH